MNGVLKRVLASSIALVGAACADSSTPGQPSGGGSGSGSLSVAIVSPQLGCYPRPDNPCLVTVEAVVANSSRPLRYSWSGCAAGTEKIASCVVLRPGDVAVSVRVTDDRGEVGEATTMATGTNQPPVATITDFVLWESWYPASGGGSFEVSARIADPERPTTSDCGPNGGSSTTAVTASGICTTAYARCFAGTLDVGAIKTAPSGECTFAMTAKDEWGATTTTTKTFTLPTSKLR